MTGAGSDDPSVLRGFGRSLRSAERSRPAVTVVVIVYNDAERLPAAVASVLRQTFADIEVVICDDGSTDDTPKVSGELRDLDPRVRCLRLAQNSGGCSAPRNAGLESARAAWVTFLDSDDEMPAGALQALLHEGERTGAEVVAGKVSRYNVERREWSGWHLSLYESPRFLHSINEEPRRLFDTLSVGKLYRVDFLLRTGQVFVPGILFEDCLWTIQVYANAGRLAVIPDHVYTWKAYETAENPSITNSRTSTSNVEARIETNKLIDDWLIREGHPDLLPAKQLKFISHDLAIYLGDLHTTEDTWGAQLVERLKSYAAHLPGLAVDELPSLQRLALWALQHGRPADIGAVFRALARGEFATDLIEVAGRTLWSAGEMEAGRIPGQLLDISDLRLGRHSFGQVALAHDLAAWRYLEGRVHVSFVTWSHLGLLDGPGVRVWLEIERRGSGGQRARVSHTESRRSGFVWETRFDFDPAVLPWSTDEVDQRFDLRLLVRIDGMDVESRRAVWFPRPGPGLDMSDIPLDRESRGWRIDRLRPIRALDGRLALRASPAAPTDRARGMGLVLARGSGSLRAGRTSESGARLVDAIAKRRRIRRSVPLAVFTADRGRSYSDSPRYIYEELLRSTWSGEAVWVRDRFGVGIPDDVETVLVGSREYYRALGSARYWISNRGFSDELRKPSRTTFIRTSRGPARDHGLIAADGGAMAGPSWDVLVTSCGQFPTSLDHPVRAGVRVLRLGTPAVDPLLGRRGSSRTVDDDRALGLLRSTRGPQILYASTTAVSGSARSPDLGLPRFVEAASRRLDASGRLLLRTPYSGGSAATDPRGHVVLNASAMGDPNVAMLASDVLVTEASPLVFDYVLLGRPLIIFQPDRNTRVARIGDVVLDRQEEMPGPIAESHEQLWTLIATIGTWAPEFARLRADFAAKYCSGEDGHASRRVVEVVFSG